MSDNTQAELRRALLDLSCELHNTAMDAQRADTAARRQALARALERLEARADALADSLQ